jgi:hypothetical protein
MGCQSNAADATAGGAASVPLIGSNDDWRAELAMAATVRVNLLLVGTGAVPVLLEMLEKDLQTEAILSWRPGEQLELPTPGRPATFILHDVHELAASDQAELVRWLDEAAGWIRVIGTSEEPLWPHVKSGSFDETLYYRLNTVYVDMRARQSESAPA